MHHPSIRNVAIVLAAWFAVSATSRAVLAQVPAGAEPALALVGAVELDDRGEEAVDQRHRRLTFRHPGKGV